MNSIIKHLRLYRFKSLFVFIHESWKNSAYLKQKYHTKNRLYLWIDQIYWYVCYGHDYNDYCSFKFWEKSRKDKKSYISLRRNDALCKSFCTKEIHALFLDKARFNKRFENYVKRGWIISPGKTQKDIEDFIAQYKTVIAKPLKDFGGHGVIKITTSTDNYKNDIQKLLNLIKQGEEYILEQSIENVDYIKKLSPSSLNTIRIVTVIDKRGELHIIAALLRMGNGFAVTDNYHDGGMACPIDVQNSMLCKTAFGMNCKEYDVHPFSEVVFEGYPVPDFSRCLEIIKEVSFYEPEARYVGWDLAVTPQGIELLEGNIPPGEDITQIATGQGMWYQMLDWNK